MENYEDKLADFYEKAIIAIASGVNVQKFTQLVYDSFQMNIIVVDEGYQFIACAGQRPFPDPYWETIASHGNPSNDTIINDYINAGYLDAIAQKKNAVYVNWGVALDYPQTSGAIYTGDQLQGFVSILFLRQELSALSVKLNTMLAKLYSILFQTCNVHNLRTQNPVREVFSRKFFDTIQYPEAPAADDYRPFLNIRSSFLVAVLQSVRGNINVLEHIRGRIRSFREDTIYFRRDDLLFLFFYGIHEEKPVFLMNQFLSLTERYEIRIGLSEIFDNIKKRSVYIQQAEYALKAERLTKPIGKVAYYPDCYLPAILLHIPEKFYEENAIPPEIQMLRRFDTENHTDYLLSLKTYLYYRNNLNCAASCLHLHRNSLKYRLVKIESLTGISVDDPDTARRLEIGFLLSDMIDS